MSSCKWDSNRRELVITIDPTSSMKMVVRFGSDQAQEVRLSTISDDDFNHPNALVRRWANFSESAPPTKASGYEHVETNDSRRFMQMWAVPFYRTVPPSAFRDAGPNRYRKNDPKIFSEDGGLVFMFADDKYENYDDIAVKVLFARI